MNNSSAIRKIYTILKKTYPDAHCQLHFRTPWQLLIATILSAQGTDIRVNIVTKDLFKKYTSIKAFAHASLKVLEKDIHSVGFYHTKAKNIINSCTMLIEQFSGKLPQTIEAMTQLPGVGRKTANVVLGNGMGIITGIAVDTHVIRISYRLGLTRHTEPEKIEQDLMALFPKKEWTLLSHYLIAHGRSLCKAQRPLCGQCPLRPFCAYEQKKQC